MTAPIPVSDRALARAAGGGFVSRTLHRLAGKRGAQLGGVWIAIMLLTAVFAPLLASSHPLLWKHEGAVSSPWLRHLTRTDVILLGSLLAAAAAGLWRGGAAGRFAGWVLVVSAAVAAAAGRSFVDLVSDNPQPSAGRVAFAAVGLAALAAGLLALAAAAWGAFRRSGHRWRCFAALLGLALAAVLALAPLQPPATVVHSVYREAEARGEVNWAVRAPLPFSPNDAQRDAMSAEGRDARLERPSLAHPLGTDRGGADVLSRMIHATRIALAIGLIATGIAAAIGIVVGGLMGYFAGLTDLLGMRLVEIFSAIPVLFLLIMIVAFYGRSLTLMMVVIGLTGWVGYALFVRAEFLKLRSLDYVMAARALGLPLRSILLRHMLPNGVTPVLVLASFGIASAILAESTLSFLGLGLVEEPSWGQLLNQSRSAPGQWGLLIFPGLAIFLTVFAYNLVGEAMRDALDVRT
ncbi:ABC transporter permease [Phycisphaera mikurensis]|uniref:Putative ABC transporter permease protein n=1 Tax=Phycisphaera mikurensis (strain NBRC 102666 / KCTC 22515 / FYK2301M01) TaxID=1142394 RepID=I0IHC8_PHYMF|nr:ABC transporter permease [Phycisphaera mikurensis]MBB6440915.1 peptide/nickel transport system permease protein [Phycisphaera mikurensis]BAM04666.1 putative ABC transporter permease protein [Phycisphaera mikurensis NBRC 102666]